MNKRPPKFTSSALCPRHSGVSSDTAALGVPGASRSFCVFARCVPSSNTHPPSSVVTGHRARAIDIMPPRRTLTCSDRHKLIGDRRVVVVLRLGLVLVVALAVLVLATGQQQAQAQGASHGWTEPDQVVNTSGTLATSGIALLSDRYGALHLFYTRSSDESSSPEIDYQAWDGTAWTSPIDIVVDTSGEGCKYVHAVIDDTDTVHLFWTTGSSLLSYSSAKLTKAGSAASWSRPKRIASALYDSGPAIDGAGNLYVAFSSYPTLGDVLISSSADGGGSWTRPHVVASAAAGSAPNEVRLAFDGTGVLHAVWTEYQLPEGWPPTGCYYARSKDRGVTWSPPLQVAPISHGQLGVAAFGLSEVHLLWRSTVGGDGTFYQYSSDGGLSWSPSTNFADGGGFSGLPSFAVDPSGQVHFVTGYSSYGSSMTGAVLSYNRVLTQQVLDRAKESPGERAALAITRGDQLHIVFEVDYRSLLHTTLRLENLPAPTATATRHSLPTATRTRETPTATLRLSASPTTTPRPTSAPYSTRRVTSPTTFAVWIGASASAVLVASIILLALVRNRKS